MPTECLKCGEELDGPAFLCDTCHKEQNTIRKRVQRQVDERVRALRDRMSELRQRFTGLLR